jgi:hypothetical protein
MQRVLIGQEGQRREQQRNLRRVDGRIELRLRLRYELGLGAMQEVDVVQMLEVMDANEITARILWRARAHAARCVATATISAPRHH